MNNYHIYRENFIKEFGSDRILQLNGLTLLKEMFALKNRGNKELKQFFGNEFPLGFESMCYWLERKEDKDFYTVDFGSCRGGQHYKFFIYYCQKNQSWMKRSEKISVNDAIIWAEKIRDLLVEASSYLNKDNFEEFYEFVNNDWFDEETKVSELFRRAYIHKYLHILFPNYISSIHSENWQKYYKNKMNINSKELFSFEKNILKRYDFEGNFVPYYKILTDKYGTPHNPKKNNYLEINKQQEKFEEINESDYQKGGLYTPDNFSQNGKEAPTQKPNKSLNGDSEVYILDKKVRAQALYRSNYLCEIDNNHITFVSRATSKNYVEGHHLIPMSAQDNFDTSIDVTSNIIALCPNCHRAIHNSAPEEQRELISKLFGLRKSRLKKQGINIILDDLITIYTKQKTDIMSQTF